MKQIYTLIIFSLIFTSISTAASKSTISNSFESKVSTEFNAKAIKRIEAVLNISVTVAKAICSDANSGKIYVTIADGTSPYTVEYYIRVGGTYQLYKTHNGITDKKDSLVKVGIGDYLVKVKDAAGSSSDAKMVTISYDSPAFMFPAISNNISCNGANDGSINAYVYGGTSPYLFKITSTSGTVTNTTGDFENLAPGDYSLSVSDNGGCNVSYPSAITLTEPTLLTLAITSTTDAKGCNNGAVTLSASGGTTPYLEYLLNTSTSTTGTFSNVAPGPYTTSVTDKNGCTATAGTVTIKQTVTPLAATFTSTAVKCKGASTGSITVNSSDGTPNYTYTLAQGTTTISSSSATANKTYSFSNLAAGTYTASVSDANGCIVSKSVTVSEPTATLAVNLTKVDVSVCFGNANGSITATASGGTVAGNYNFTLLPNTGTTSQQSASVMKFSGLTAQSYTVTVTDDNLCTANQSITVAAPTGTPLSVSATTTNATCNGLSDGKVTLAGAGGNIGYTPATYYQYAYTTGSAPTSYGTTATFSNLAKGSYTAWVKDGNGCTASSTFSIDAPTAITVTATPTDVTGCNGNTNGSITAKATGGNGTYSYTLTPGNVTNTTGTFSNLAAGSSYVVSVIDAKNCTAASPATTISQPTAITATTSTTSPLCAGGSTGTISVAATGGTAPLTYTLVELPSAVFTSGKFSNIPAGTYTVHIVDKNSCTKDITGIIVKDATAITLGTPTVTNVKCKGSSTGEIAISATGGTGTFTYTISPSAGNPYSGGKFTGLPAGTYTVTATDGNGCTKTSSSIQVTEPSSTLTLGTPSSTNISTCYNDATGSITMSASGSTAPYTFTLAPGGTVITGASATFSNLAAGSYTVAVADANSCETKTSSSIQITAPDSIAFSTTTVAAVCKTPGSITVSSVSGGAGGYTYSINGGTPQTSNIFDKLVAGTYAIVVHDKNSCTSHTHNVKVTSTSGTVNLSISNIQSDNGFNSGSFTASASGGTSPYQYAVNGSAYSTKSVYNGLHYGNYIVTAEDNNGCESKPDTVHIVYALNTLDVSVTQPASLTCYGDATASIKLTINNGKPAYTVSVTNSKGTAITGTQPSSNVFLYQNLAADSYSIQVVDGTTPTALGYKDVVNIVAPSQISISNIAASTLVCHSDSIASLTVTATGGTGSLSYYIDPTKPSTTGVIDDVKAGATYKVYAEDSKGCKASKDVTVTRPASLVITATPNSTNMSITADVTSGGTAPYSYALGNSSFSATNTWSGLAAGTYIVKAKDANGCTDSTSVILKVSGPITVVPDSVCGSSTDGQAKLTINFGTASYSCTLFRSTTGKNGIYRAYPDSTKAPTKFYIWSGNTYTKTNLPSGYYIINITDRLGITNVDTFYIHSKKINITADTDGDKMSITVHASGGSNPYTYTIKGTGVNVTQTDSIFTSLAKGTYNVIAADSKGCSDSITVTLNPSQIKVVVTPDTVCHNSTGNANFKISTGVSPYTFKVVYAKDTIINTILTKQDTTLTNLKSGKYYYQLYDQSGLSRIDSFAIVETTIKIDTSFNRTTMKLTIHASGGKAPYQYALDNGSFSTDSVFNVKMKTYTIHVVDSRGCEDTLSVNLKGHLKVRYDLVKDTICKNDHDGQLIITPLNGTPNYTLVINYDSEEGSIPFTKDYSFSNLFEGTYSLHVEDANGLSNDTTINIVATNLTIKADADSKAKTITVHASGGSAPYSYALNNWSPMQSDSIFTGLSIGKYWVNVKDKNGCIDSLQVDMTYPPLPVTVTMVKDTICEGSKDGIIVIKPTGGTPSYTFEILSGTTSVDKGSFAESDTIRNLGVGSYDLKVFDKDSTLRFDSIIVIVPYPKVKIQLVADPKYTAPSTCSGGTDGKMTVTMSGGTPPYSSYYWLVDGKQVKDSTLSNVASNVYFKFYVTDALCTTVDSFKITSTYPPIHVNAFKADSTTCTTKKGTLTVKESDISGGTAPYTYSWTDPDGKAMAETGLTLTNLEGGGYTLKITDSKTCTHDTTLTVPFKNNLKISLTAYNIITIPKDTLTKVNVKNDTLCIQSPLLIAASTYKVAVDKFTWLWTTGDVPQIKDYYTGTDSTSIVVGASDKVMQYHVRAQLGACKADSIIKINLHPFPVLTLAPEETIGKGDSYKFEPKIIAGTFDESTFSYKWSPSYSMLDNDTIKNPTFTYKDSPSGLIDFPFQLQLIYDNTHNCSLVDSTILHLAGDVDPQSPKLGNNALTPNGDGINDFWYIRNAEYYPLISVEVYNRWGEQVYKQTGYDNSSKVWRGTYNGNKLPSGTYYYIIKLNGHAKALTGTVTIIR